MACLATLHCHFVDVLVVQEASASKATHPKKDKAKESACDARREVCVQFQPSPCIQAACMLLVHVTSRCSWCSRAQSHCHTVVDVLVVQEASASQATHSKHDKATHPEKDRAKESAFDARQKVCVQFSHPHAFKQHACTCTCNIQMFMVLQGSIEKGHVNPKKKVKPVSDSSAEHNVDDGGDKTADAEEEEEEVCMYSKRLHKQISRNYYQTYVLSNGPFFHNARRMLLPTGICQINWGVPNLGLYQFFGAIPIWDNAKLFGVISNWQIANGMHTPIHMLTFYLHVAGAGNSPEGQGQEESNQEGPCQTQEESQACFRFLG